MAQQRQVALITEEGTIMVELPGSFGEDYVIPSSGHSEFLQTWKEAVHGSWVGWDSNGAVERAPDTFHC